MIIPIIQKDAVYPFMLQDLISKLLPTRTTMKNDHPDAYIM